MGAHTTSDDPTRYRVSSELEAWKLKDPIERMRSYLFKQQLADADFVASVEAEADALAARVREGCLSMPDPDPLFLFENVYDETTPLLEEQKEALGTYLAGFAGGVH
jgi:pyruvate dehydrogenase E1 component alpha subunit